MLSNRKTDSETERLRRPASGEEDADKKVHRAVVSCSVTAQESVSVPWRRAQLEKELKQRAVRWVS